MKSLLLFESPSRLGLVAGAGRGRRGARGAGGRATVVRAHRRLHRADRRARRWPRCRAILDPPSVAVATTSTGTSVSTPSPVCCSGNRCAVASRAIPAEHRTIPASVSFVVFHLHHSILAELGIGGSALIVVLLVAAFAVVLRPQVGPGADVVWPAALATLVAGASSVMIDGTWGVPGRVRAGGGGCGVAHGAGAVGGCAV